MEENTTVQSAPVEQATETEQRGTVGLSTDERTGKKIITSIPSTETVEPTVQTAQAEQAQAEQTEEPSPSPFENYIPKETVAPQTYTPAEMSLAMQLGQVDESRIPAEYMPQYKAMQLKDAPPPKSPEEVRQEFLDKVTENVKEQTLKEVGLTEDELALGEYSDDEDVKSKVERYKLALEMNRRKAVDTVYDRIKSEQEAVKAQQQFQDGVVNWINIQKAQEPHFDEIGQYMTDYYKSMKYEDAKNIAPAMEAALNGNLTPQYAEVIQKYYEGCRKEFYAKLNGTSTTPTARVPDVETKGGGRNVSENPDFGKLLREASPRDKSRVVDAWLKSMRG